MTELKTFEALGLSDRMLEAVKAKGFESPSPIQALTIPALLNTTNDIIAQAQTGTGKTAAFGLPLIDLLEKKDGAPSALILVPTRELALQVTEELVSFNKLKKLSIAAIYGGASISEQLRRLKKGIDIVVGTPGRILDHIRRQTLDLSNISWLVLDEADEMLNMGFIEDIEEIIKSMNSDKRVMLFSATMPARIVALSKKYMRDTKILKVESPQLTTELTNQIYFEVRESDKFDALTRIIDVEPEFYGIVFSRTKIGVDEMVNRLLERGYAAEGLHGDVSQAQREKILRKFKNRHANILVATDVAARGIDINNLTHVINYSLPQDSESYVHRIGRTGRAGNQGTAITFISNSELRQFGFMKRDIKVEIKREKLPTAQDVIQMKRNKIKDDLQEIVDSGNYSDCGEMARDILEKYEPEVALSALLRLAYKNELSTDNYPEIRTFSVDRRGKARLFISIGRLDGYDARKMASLLKRECDLSDSQIDDLKVMESYTFVTVPFAAAEQTIKKLNTLRKGDRPIAEIARDSRENQSQDTSARGRGRKEASRKRQEKEPAGELPETLPVNEVSEKPAPKSQYKMDGEGDWFDIFESRFGGSESKRKKSTAKSETKSDKKSTAKGVKKAAGKPGKSAPAPVRKESRRSAREKRGRK